VGNARKLQAHLNSTESPRQHQIVEAAEVPDSKYLSREFGKAGSERHIEIVENYGAQLVGVVPFGQVDGGDYARIFARLFANDL